MIKLTDLEIRKEISMMELKRQFPEAKTIEFNERQNCFWVEAVGFTSWPLLDPLTDDALIFNLAFKHEVKIDYFDECVYMKYPLRKLARHCFDKGNIASLRKAILLAIIEAHKENV